jgi:hypothetical protein
MSSWTSDELRRIGDATELRVSSQRPDGTLRPATTIWHSTLGEPRSQATMFWRPL